MKHILIILLSLASFSGHTQDWTQQYDGQPVFDLHFYDQQTGWAGGGDLLLRTTNGGNNWQEIINQRFSTIIDMEFSDLQTGWLLVQLEHDASKRILLHTNDGGIYWEKIGDFDFSNYNSIHFLDKLNGWIAGDGGRIRHTVDGGQTWTAQASSTLVDIDDIRFHDLQIGWAVGGNQEVLKTENGGLSWSKILHGLDVGYFLTAISIVDVNHLWIGGRWGTVIGTADGGDTWTDYSLPPDPNGPTPDVEAIQFINENEGWISFDDDVWHTDDGGSTWGVFAEQMVDQLFFSDSMNGCLFHNGNMHCTNDGGNTWTLSYINSGRHVHFFNTHEMYVVAPHDGLLYKTFDGGLLWDTVKTLLHLNYGNFDFKNEMEGVSLGRREENSSSVILKTENGGQSFWPIHKSGYFLQDVAYAGEHTLFAVGAIDEGLFLKTEDGIILTSDTDGQDWVVLADDLDYSVSNVECFDNAECVFIGRKIDGFGGSQYSVFGKIVNGNVEIVSQYENIYLNQLQFVNEAVGYALGSDSGFDKFQLYKTINGGDSWSCHELPVGIDYKTFYFVSTDVGWMITDDHIYKTENSGSTWILEDTFPFLWASGLHVVDGYHAWISNDDGIFFNDKINPQSEQAKSDMIFPVYPNPTSGVFQFECEYPNTILEIYSVDGKPREIFHFTHAGLQEIDMADYQGGIYLLKIINEQGVYVQQLVKS